MSIGNTSVTILSISIRAVKRISRTKSAGLDYCRRNACGEIGHACE
jgi:hypothetical protein